MKEERITIDRAELEQLKRLATQPRRIAVYSSSENQFAWLILIFCVSPVVLMCLYYIVADGIDQLQEGQQQKPQKQLVHQK